MDETKQQFIREILKREKIINENKELLKSTKYKRLIKIYIKILTDEIRTYENEYYQLTSNKIYQGDCHE